MNEQTSCFGLPVAGVRKRVEGIAIRGFFEGAATWAARTPQARRAMRALEIQRDIAYQAPREDGSHLLDVYRPKGAATGDSSGQSRAKLPIVLHVHGGGFRILSKDTHWIMGCLFARHGAVVFNINYRLSPQHPFPAALEDCARAYRWVLENAERFGGDPDQLFLAGESAGANLITSMTIAACMPRDEPYARAIYETAHVPKAVIPICGYLQASEVERPHASKLVQNRVDMIREGYLDHATTSERALADPVCVLESDAMMTRSLPPFFIPYGGADAVRDDSIRLESALQRRGISAQARGYEGGIHAFHAFYFHRLARRCWADIFHFMDALDAPQKRPRVG